jgi:hypothetical protein
MNAGLAFFLADEMLTANGGSTRQPPRSLSRRPPRRWRVFLLAVALAVLVLGTLGRNAVADSALSGATAQSGGDESAGAASAKKKRSAGKPKGQKKRHRTPRALDLYYGAKIRGTAKYDYTDSLPANHPDTEYTQPASGQGSASLRADRVNVNLTRELVTDPNTGRTIRYYGFQLNASAELSNGSATDVGHGWHHRYDASGCSPGTTSQTEPGPSPIDSS